MAFAGQQLLCRVVPAVKSFQQHTQFSFIGKNGSLFAFHSKGSALKSSQSKNRGLCQSRINFQMAYNQKSNKTLSTSTLSRKYHSSTRLADEEEEPVASGKKREKFSYIDKVFDRPPRIAAEADKSGNMAATFGVGAILLYLFGYTWYIMREEKMIERYEFIGGGSSMDRETELAMVRKYLNYEAFGINSGQRMWDYGIGAVVVRCLHDPSPRVQELAIQVLCYFAASSLKIRANMINEFHLDDDLHRFADKPFNIHYWYLLGSLADYSESAQLKFAHDPFIIQCLAEELDRSIQLRDTSLSPPVHRLLSILTRTPEGAKAVYAIAGPQLAESVSNTQTLWSATDANWRIHLARYSSAARKDANFAPYAQLDDSEEAGELPYLAIQAALVGVTGYAWAWFKTMRWSSKFRHRLSQRDVAWLSTARIRSPIAAIGMSIALWGFGHLEHYVSTNYAQNSFRELKYYVLAYAWVPAAFWYLTKWGHFCILPSFVRFRKSEAAPSTHEQLMELAGEILQGLELPFFRKGSRDLTIQPSQTALTSAYEDQINFKPVPWTECVEDLTKQEKKWLKHGSLPWWKFW